MALSLFFTSCERDDGTDVQDPTGAVEAVNESGRDDAELGLQGYSPPITLTFVRENSEGLEDLIANLPGETLEDNRWSRIYEQALGIKVAYDWVANGDLYHQKLGVALTSGDIPDVVKVNAEQLRQLNNGDLIQDLTEVYESYATPLTKRILNEEGSGPFETATMEGKLMAIPETRSSIEGAQYLWIRTDWLEKLDLQPPRTMQDVLRISKAFTEEDPDGNGEQDTFGLGLSKNLYDPVLSVWGFMAGYDAFPKIWIKGESGRLVYGGVQPEVRKALQTLQELYRSGQIDSEFALKDELKVREHVASGKIGMLYGEQWSSFFVQASRETDPDAEWQAFPIVSDSGEKATVPLRFSTYQFLAVRKGYDHPEAIVKLFNLHLEKNWGATADYDTYYSTPYPAWQLSPVTPFPALKNLEAYRQLEEARRTGDASALKDEAKAIQKSIDIYLAGNADKESGWGWERTYGPEGAFSVLTGYIEHEQLLFEQFLGAPTETMVEKKAILDKLQDDTFVNIIIGNPIEDFDRFVEEWHVLGGDRMTAEVNQWSAVRGGEH
ncbi:extracellular solute-binding protein [Paenibacillus sp. TRM 82003]|nr:extracellular solute-binding protein [Paenibacillus sp. TRM 82003]